MEQKAYEQTQKPKARKKRTLRKKYTRVAGTTAVKKNRGKVKMSEHMLELEKERDELKLIIKLIENHAAIGFDNELLAFIKEVKKDPFGFDQAMKKKK